MQLRRHRTGAKLWFRSLIGVLLALSVLPLPSASAVVQAANAEVTGFYWVDQDWLVAEFSGTGLDVEWTLDGAPLTSYSDYPNAMWWQQHGDVMGKYCVRARSGAGAWSPQRCLADIDPVQTSTTTSSISVQWDSVTYDPTVMFLVAELDGVVVTSLPSNSTSYTFAGLQAGTSYDVGVYPVMNQGEHPRLNNVTVSTVSNDTTAPSRPGWGRFWSQTANSITLKWAPSTDNVGVTSYGVRLGSGARINLPATARSHTFNNLAPGRHRVDVVAIDAAGNMSTQRAAYQNVQSTAAQTATRTAVDDIVAAIEAFGAANGNFTDIGGYQGYGWFAYRNGTSYPEKINTTLINAGFLDAQYATLAYSDYMIYRCGSGDDVRVGVFGFMPDGTAVAGDWQGCTESPFYYGHHFFGVTRTLAEVQDTTVPSRPGWNGYQFDGTSTTFNWKASTDNVGVTGYRARIEGTNFDVTLSASARSHTFNNVPARAGAYVWNITALDAAGNASATRRSGFRILSAAENTATITAVDDVVAALEAYALDNGDFKAGAANGHGWFNYSNGTSYPTKMAANLIDGGYLDEQYRNIYYWDLMVYGCGAGDDQRVAVLSTADKATSAADLSEWSGCNRHYETVYGHDYYRVTQRLGNLDEPDTTAPSRPAPVPSAGPYSSISSDSVTLRWGASTDDTGVVGFRVEIPSLNKVVNVGPGIRSHTFTGLAPGRYYVRARAVDAAGNLSSTRALTARVMTAAQQADAIASTGAIADAIEAFVADGNEFADLGGYRGYGWFSYENGTSYPTKISDTLVDGGYLDASHATGKYYDFLIYHCGSGDNQFAGVFSFVNSDTARAPTGPNAWASSCSKNALRYYARHYHVTTATLAVIRERPTVPEISAFAYDPAASPNASVSWTGNAPEYEWVWKNDGIAITLPGRANVTSTDQLVVAAGLLCIEVQAVSGSVKSDPATACREVNAIPEIEFAVQAPAASASVEYSPAHALLVTWPESDLPEVRGFEVRVDGALIETVAPSENSYLITGLQPITDYDVGVYAVAWWPFDDAPQTTTAAARTQRGVSPPTEPVFNAWAGSPQTAVLQWGYSEFGSPFPADDTGVVHYSITIDGHQLPYVLGADERSHTLTDLFPSTEVTVHITAVDEDGNSTNSREINVTTPANPPPPPVAPPPAADTISPIWGGSRWPQIQAVDVVQPGSVRVHWCCALDFDQYNVVPASFDVFTKRAWEPSSSYQLYANVPAFNTGAEIILSGLTENDEYSVLIVAIDWVGNRSEGLQRDGVIPRGGPPALEPAPIDGVKVGDPAPQNPPAPPTNTHTTPPEDPGFSYPIPTPVGAQVWDCTATTFPTRVSAVSAQVSWSGGLDGHSEWTVIARRSDNNMAVPGIAFVDRPNATIVRLQPETQYLLTVAASDVNGDGLGSCTFGITTEEVPPRPPIGFGDPECLSVDSLSPRAVTISFDPNHPGLRLPGTFEQLRIRVFRAGEHEDYRNEIIPDWDFDGLADESVKIIDLLRPSTSYTIFLDKFDNDYRLEDTPCVVSFITPAAPIHQLNGAPSAVGLCSAVGASFGLAGEAGACVWINEFGQVATITGLTIGVGPEAELAASFTLAYADTGDFDAIGGVSYCGSVSGTYGVGVTATYCRGGWRFQGPNVFYAGVTGGIGGGGSVGVNYSWVDDWDGDPVTLKEDFCVVAKDLRLWEPAFCSA